MRAYPLFIFALASGIFAAAVIGAQDTGPECLTCHTGTAPKGGYLLELPDLLLQAPVVLNGSSSFQLLVMLTYDDSYAVISPKAEVICTCSGVESFREGMDLDPTDGGHSAIIRVNVTEGPVDVSVSVEMFLYFDHPDPEEPDLIPYFLSRSIQIGVGSPAGETDEELPVPEQAPSLLIPVMASVPILTASFFRRRRTERL